MSGKDVWDLALLDIKKQAEARGFQRAIDLLQSEEARQCQIKFFETSGTSYLWGDASYWLEQNNPYIGGMEKEK